jgi:hypothetical protein
MPTVSILVDGAVAQLVERLVRNEKVRGSNPLGSTTLPLEALDMAFKQRRPPDGLVHHSVRGVQYASAVYRKSGPGRRHPEHEPQRQLLRQCQHGKFLEYP